MVVMDKNENSDLSVEQDRGVPSIKTESPVKKNIIFALAIVLVSIVAVNASLKKNSAEEEEKLVDQRYGTGVKQLPQKVANDPNAMPSAFVLPNKDKKQSSSNTYNYYITNEGSVTNEGDQYQQNPNEQRRQVNTLDPRVQQPTKTNNANSIIDQKRRFVDAQTKKEREEERWKRRQASPVLFERGRAVQQPTGMNSSDPFDQQMAQLNKELNALTNGLPQTPDMRQMMPGMMPGGGQPNVDSNQAFADRVNSQIVETATAMPMGDLEFKIVQGKVIPCTLETAIDSSLPGMVRCVVSKDVYGETGRTVLIPRGGRIVGQYNSAIKNGQYRVFIVWSRVITNDYDIAIGSPGTDNLGRAGNAGEVDSHFWTRFGNATLLSLLGAGTASYGNDGQVNAANAYRLSMANSFADQANNSLSQNINIPDTIHKDQGEKIKIMAAKDLDFTLVMKSLSAR